MRPTNKYIHAQYTDRVMRDMETVDKATKVKQLKDTGHSCLTCKHFPVRNPTYAIVKCKKSSKYVKHYNICHQHEEFKVS